MPQDHPTPKDGKAFNKVPTPNEALAEELFDQMAEDDNKALKSDIIAIIRNLEVELEHKKRLLIDHDRQMDVLRVQVLEQKIDAKQTEVQRDIKHNLQIQTLSFENEKAARSLVQKENDLKSMKGTNAAERKLYQKDLLAKDIETTTLRRENEHLKAQNEKLRHENTALRNDQRKQFHFNNLDHKSSEQQDLKAQNETLRKENSALCHKDQRKQIQILSIDKKRRDKQLELDISQAKVQELAAKVAAFACFTKFQIQRQFPLTTKRSPLTWEEMEQAMRGAAMGARVGTRTASYSGQVIGCKDMIGFGSAELRRSVHRVDSRAAGLRTMNFYEALADICATLLENVQEDDHLRDQLLQDTREIKWAQTGKPKY